MTLAAILFSFFVHYEIMPESQLGDKPLLQDSEYNIIHQLEKKAGFSTQELKSTSEMQRKATSQSL